MRPAVRSLLFALLRVCGRVGRWFARKLARMGVEAVDAWIDGRCDGFLDRARAAAARGRELRARWLRWRSRRWRAVQRWIRANGGDAVAKVVEGVDAVREELGRRLRSVPTKPDSYSAWARRRRGR